MDSDDDASETVRMPQRMPIVDEDTDQSDWPVDFEDDINVPVASTFSQTNKSNDDTHDESPKSFDDRLGATTLSVDGRTVTDERLAMLREQHAKTLSEIHRLEGQQKHVQRVVECIANKLPNSSPQAMEHKSVRQE